jgi:hypothetical protein
MTELSQTCSRVPSSRGVIARWRSLAAIGLVCAILGACTGEQFQKGYILPAGALEQIPIGASQDQVLIVMGTPSTVATLDGEVFYYISQRSERPVAFMNQKVVDQRVIASILTRIAKCGGCQLRPAGRQDLRLHRIPRRPPARIELPDAAVQATQL